MVSLIELPVRTSAFRFRTRQSPGRIPEMNTRSAIMPTLLILQIAANLPQIKDYLHKQVHILVLSVPVDVSYDQQITIKVIDDNFLLKWIPT